MFPSNERGNETINGPLKIKGQTLKGVNFRSYLKDSNGPTHKYMLNISGLKNFENIEIMQDSLIDNSVLSFDLKSLMIDSKKVPEKDITRTYYKDNLPKSIQINNLDGQSENLKLEMEVEEANNTVSEFKLILR